MNIKQSPEQKNNSLTGFLGKLVRARWVTFIIGGLLCLYSISGIFVFRKIPYLSDNTYAVVRWPLACILIGALSLLINLGLFYAKKSKPRKIMLILSALAVVSLIGNSIIYQLNKEDSVDPGTVAYETSAVMDGQTLMAGAAKGDITPADEMFPMPLLAVIRFDKAIDHVYQSYRLRLFIIGDFAMQGISAEVVTSVGKAVLETSPYENTMLVTLANGYEGYVINEWEFDHDAFEKDLTRAARGVAEPAFVEGFEDLFADVVP